MTDRVPIKTAARILGWGVAYLQQEMRNKRVDLGYARKVKKNYTYFVYRAKLEKLIGRELTDADLVD